MSDRSTIRYTYEDYMAIPEDTSRRHEIVDGELFVTPAPRPRHQEVVTNIVRLLATRALDHDLGKVFPGPITVRLHEEGVVEPDVVFVRADRLDIVDPDGGVDGPPDLVVEVLSPSNRDYDRGVKRKQYMERGVAVLWLADPGERWIEVWRPGAGEPELVRDVVVWEAAGLRFELPLDEVFRG